MRDQDCVEKSIYERINGEKNGELSIQSINNENCVYYS